MGVDVDPEVMIGIWFEHEDSAKGYIEKIVENVFDEEYWEEGLPEGDWPYCMKEGFSFVQCTGYSDRGGCFGIQVSCDDLKEGSNTIDKYYQKLREVVPKEDWDKIEAHIWARYW